MPSACRDRAATPVKKLTLAAVLAVTLGASLSSCFVEPLSDVALVTLTLDLGQLEQGLESLPGYRGADGLVHLDEVPVTIQVEVNGPGIDEASVASWPEEGPANPRQEVSVTLEVPAGLDRVFSIVAHVYQGGEVRVWRDDGTLIVDLEGGRASTLGAPLAQLSRGRIECELIGPGAGSVAEVVAVDGDPALGFELGPGVAWPPVAVQDGRFSIEQAPVGRPLSFRLWTGDGETAMVSDVQVAPRQAGETATCAIAVP